MLCQAGRFFRVDVTAGSNHQVIVGQHLTRSQAHLVLVWLDDLNFFLDVADAAGKILCARLEYILLAIDVKGHKQETRLVVMYRVWVDYSDLPFVPV